MPPLTEQVQSLLDQFPQLVASLVAAAAIMVATLLIATWIGRAVATASRRRQADPALTQTLQQLVRWGVITLGVVLAVEQVVPNVTSLLAGLGIAGFTIGFALQDVAKNFIAGVLLLLQRPFELGDTVNVADITGEVTAIDLRTTEINTPDGLYVTIPNMDVFASKIVNYTRAESRRIVISIQLPLDSDLAAAASQAELALETLPGKLVEPAQEIIFEGFGDSSIELGVYFWADMRQASFTRVRDAAVRQLKQGFDEAGIALALPPIALLHSSGSGQE